MSFGAVLLAAGCACPCQSFLATIIPKVCLHCAPQISLLANVTAKELASAGEIEATVEQVAQQVGGTWHSHASQKLTVLGWHQV
jgi:hypothetical protein